MTRDDVDSLVYRMDAEGFHYCFDGYSRWQEIDDETFQELRRAYLKSAKELKDYIIYMDKEFNEDE